VAFCVAFILLGIPDLQQYVMSIIYDYAKLPFPLDNLRCPRIRLDDGKLIRAIVDTINVV